MIGRTRKSHHILLAGVAVCLFSASAAMGQNLVVNGGFETPVVSTNEGWNVFPSSQVGWTILWNGGSATYQGMYIRPADPLLEFHNGNVAGSTAYEGNQKVELDSD